MSDIKTVSEMIRSGELDDLLKEIYGSETDVLDAQRERYLGAIAGFEEHFPEEAASGAAVHIFSAPGRTEICGNHTDHQNGCVLAAAIDRDVIVIAQAGTDKDTVRIWSEGYGMVEPDMTRETDEDTGENVLFPYTDEYGTTEALVRGIYAGAEYIGYKTGGLNAYVTSDVLGGSGLSSSAAFEMAVLMTVIGLFNEDRPVPGPVTMARLGQHAENVYFGKPCGIMDQLTSAAGGVCYMDLADPENIVLEKSDASLDRMGLTLCLTDTGGSHADLTDEYAAVREEITGIAQFFGKETMREVDPKDFLRYAAVIRQRCGDRALLRAAHVIEENKRAAAAFGYLRDGNKAGFLQTVKSSGDSSFRFLQNVYPSGHPGTQPISVAIMLSESVMGDHAVSRVHGGGFAGTAQGFVEKEYTKEYIALMNNAFGAGACNAYRIRTAGAVKII